MLRQQLGDTLGLFQSTHKRHHHLHVGQTHVRAHTTHRFALHGKGFAKIFADIARCTSETQHRVFFFWLITATANEFAVFVGFEV